jgi:hypothetical protein
MREIPLSLPVSGIIRLDGNLVTVIVNRTSTIVHMETETESTKRAVFEPGVSMFDILLESALEFFSRRKYNRFTGPQLFEIAREKYPLLNKRSFLARLTASTPNSPSFKHHLSHRDYFSRIAPGIYSLENQYLPKKTSSEVNSSNSQSVHEVNH